MNIDELNLNLSLCPSYSYPTAFSCCYSVVFRWPPEWAHDPVLSCKEKSEGAQTIRCRKGKNAGINEGNSEFSAELGCVLSSGKKHHEEIWLLLPGQ